MSKFVSLSYFDLAELFRMAMFSYIVYCSNMSKAVVLLMSIHCLLSHTRSGFPLFSPRTSPRERQKNEQPTDF